MIKCLTCFTYVTKVDIFDTRKTCNHFLNVSRRKTLALLKLLLLLPKSIVCVGTCFCFRDRSCQGADNKRGAVVHLPGSFAEHDRLW
jgi:hypothetical protein